MIGEFVIYRKKLSSRVWRMKSALMALLAFCLCLPLMGDDAGKEKFEETKSKTAKEAPEKARSKNEPKNKGVIKVDSKPPLDLIIHLKKLGYSSKQVRSILRDMDVDFAKFGNEEWSAIRANLAPYVGEPPKWDLPAIDPPDQYGKYKEMFQKFKALALDGNYPAHNVLGMFYKNGIGVEQNLNEAIKWYRSGAENGCALSQYDLGHMYRFGIGLKEDEKEAVRWFQKAAEQVHAEAQFDLGRMYSDGKGVLEDDKKAVQWFQKAADQGHADAQWHLGHHYALGKGVLEDGKEAVQWWQKAAEQGHAEAQYNLGSMYENGQGVAQDLKKAKYYWELAAKQGHAKAQ